MLHRIERVLGNLHDYPVGARTVERVSIESAAMARRLVRLPTSIGDLGIMFADERRLHDGDVLFADAARVIAVAVAPDDVLVVAPHSIAQAAQIAHALGNRHIPVIHDGDMLIVAYNGVLEALLAKMDVPHRRAERVLAQPFVHAAAPHTHG